MQTSRSTTRRSFLARVAGGGLVVGAGLIVGAGGGRAVQQKREPATRRMVVDADPSDPARPPSPPAPAMPRPTDQDSGPNSDPGGTGVATNSEGPRERFVVCPGNPRCPRD